jgi:large subunit ribosomal protein L21
MDAIISTGSHQERVREGTEVLLDRAPLAEGETVTLRPLAIVEGDAITVDEAALATASVEAVVLGSVKGPKIRGFTYKAKANERRRFGHRQQYLRVRVTAITR